MEEKDILQVNATLIAGAFIFLSLSLALLGEITPILKNTSPVSEREKVASNVSTQILGAYAVIIPFTISSIAAMLARLNPAKREFRLKWAFRFMLLGFILLLIVVAAIMISVSIAT